jgi:Flp pilus assembly protein TadG
MRRPDSSHDRGAASVELAILAPAMLLVFALLIVGGRVALASDAISGVAGTAARDASIARTPAQARQIATSSAVSALRAQGLQCEGTPQVDVDVSAFAAPPGQPASVRVKVTCVVRLSDIGLPGLPGSRTLHDDASSPLDPFRGTQ